MLVYPAGNSRRALALRPLWRRRWPRRGRAARGRELRAAQAGESSRFELRARRTVAMKRAPTPVPRAVSPAFGLHQEGAPRESRSYEQ